MNLAARLQNRPWMIAVILAALVVLWLASGTLAPDRHDSADATAGADTGDALTRVQVRAQQASLVTRYISIYGRTAPARTVELKAETNGRVDRLGVDRGKPAARGAVLFTLDLRDRQARLEQARASVSEHTAAYQGQLELKPEGYVSDAQLAETRAKLDGARAELTRAELDLEYMNVRAPFAGTLQERSVEIGDFVRAGDPVATFVDNTHLIVTGSLAEQDIGHVHLNDTATALLVNGEQVEGRIRYLAPVAEEATRTFTIELEIPNPDGRLPAGVTAEMRIPAGRTLAQQLSPSLLTLDAEGRLGVSTVDERNRVVFHRVEIARSDTDGVWVTGLPESATVIIVGQGYVSAGQQVVPVEIAPETALAAERSATP